MGANAIWKQTMKRMRVRESEKFNFSKVAEECAIKRISRAYKCKLTTASILYSRGVMVK